MPGGRDWRPPDRHEPAGGRRRSRGAGVVRVRRTVRGDRPLAAALPAAAAAASRQRAGRLKLKGSGRLRRQVATGIRCKETHGRLRLRAGGAGRRACGPSIRCRRWRRPSTRNSFRPQNEPPMPPNLPLPAVTAGRSCSAIARKAEAGGSGVYDNGCALPADHDSRRATPADDAGAGGEVSCVDVRRRYHGSAASRLIGSLAEDRQLESPNKDLRAWSSIGRPPLKCDFLFPKSSRAGCRRTRCGRRRVSGALLISHVAQWRMWL